MDQICIDGLDFISFLAYCKPVDIDLKLLYVHLVQVFAQCSGQLGRGERDLVCEQEKDVIDDCVGHS